MALNMRIERMTGKLKTGNNLLKITFRGLTKEHEFRCEESSRQVFLIDKDIDWNLDSALGGRDKVIISIGTKMLANFRQYGFCCVYLHKLVQSRLVQISEDFCDSNNAPISLEITFSLHYSQSDVFTLEEPELKETMGLLDEAQSSLQNLEKSGTFSHQSSTVSLHREPQLNMKRIGLMKNKSSRFLSVFKSRWRNKSTDVESQSRLSIDSDASPRHFSESTDTGPEDEMSEIELEEVRVEGSNDPENPSIPYLKSSFHSEAYSSGLKAHDFQVCITIIEARLSGPNIDPVVCIQVGNQKKITTEKLATHRPYYNEYFVFDFREPTVTLLDKLITFTVCNSRRILRPSMVLGSFKLDIGTVYAQPDRQFYHKWAVLMDPEDILSGAKGYLKCNIAVCGKGESIKAVPRKEKEDDENNIEGNLLLPAGVNVGPLRQQAHYMLRVHLADALTPINSGVVANMRKVLTGDAGIDSMQTYVQVSFAGHTGATTVRNGTQPVWCEQIVFREMFPPLVRRMRIQLLNNDKFGKTLIATHFLDLAAISDEGRSGFLPTFGPAFIDLYGSAAESLLLNDKCASLNEGMGEGVVYRGRLLVSLAVQVFDDQTAAFSAPGVEMEPFMQSNTGLGVKEEFLFFGCIMDVSTLDKRFAEKAVHLEVTIGEGAADLLSESSGYLNRALSFSDEGEEGNRVMLKMDGPQRHCTTPSFKPIFNEASHGYLPFGDHKPCVFAYNHWYDLRWRLYHENFLSKIKIKLETALSEAEFLLCSDKHGAEQKFQNCLEQFAFDSCQYLNYLKTRFPTRGMNKLDKERQRICQREMDRLGTAARSLRTRNELVQFKIKVAFNLCHKLEVLAREPQGGLPDLLVWLVQGTRRIAYHRIPAKELIHSSSAEERGRLCGKLHNFYLKFPGRKLNGTGEMWRIQGQVTACFWLGLNKKREGLLKDLPKGYVITEQVDNIDNYQTIPPAVVEFNVSNNFEILCHLYQARSLLALDETGLSDPFARVIFQGKSATTQVIDETLNPGWDESLVLGPVKLYGQPENIKKNPPTLVVEIFDQDQMGKSEFMGQVLAVPIVKLCKEPYTEPTMQWFPVYRGIDRGGELLAAFEMNQIEVGLNDEHSHGLGPQNERKISELVVNTSLLLTKPLLGAITPVPKSIRPVLAKFRMEVIFWGVRDLKRINLLSIDKARIDIEIAGHLLKSSVITNYSKNPNFSVLSKTIDLDLPENYLFWPAITIRCIACRSFGRDALIGTHVIRQTDKVVCKCQQGTADNNGSGLAGIIDMAFGNLTPESSTWSLAVEKGQEKKKLKRETEMMKMDWWTKYYASVDVIHEEERMSRMSFASGDETVKGITGTMRLFNHGEPLGNASAASFKKKPKTTTLAKLKIFTSELENVSEFQGFRDWINTYELQRGVDIGEGSDSRVVGRFKASIASSVKNVLKCSAGKFKGSIEICKYPLSESCQKRNLRHVPSNETKHVLVRVYVVKANDLHPMDLNGKADPYLYLKLGSTVVSDKENYISKQLNPVFGKCFEIEALFPQESQLCIQVFDWDLVGRDDLIGQTCLDLEDKFYSRHRGTCGIAQSYETEGYNSWRDPLKPTQILAKLCKEHQLEGPFYLPGQVRVADKTFILPHNRKQTHKSAQTNCIQQGGTNKLIDSEVIALYALRHWQQVKGGSAALVPEHVETRSLYHPDRPGIIQGKLEMWVDMFTMDTRPPCPVDIAPRKPKSYELRVTIWNTDDVVLEDDAFFTGEKMSDIYVKGWIRGPEDTQCTDIHYRSLTGEGNFNWRFIFPFEYLEAEEKIVLTRKENIFSWDETELKIPPRLELQVWDADNFSADDFLGSLSLYLTQFPRGAKTSKQCTIDMIADDSDVPILNLFKQRRVKGWWPFIAKTDTGQHELTGKVEAEFHLLTAEEAEQSPAGYGRNDPNGLDKPNRPDSSFIWFLNPLKSMRYIIWHNYKWVIVKVVILILVIFIFIMFIYSFPSYLAKRIVGA